jgi:CTP:molybdopterin cytidylyltransferase MocA
VARVLAAIEAGGIGRIIGDRPRARPDRRCRGPSWLPHRAQCEHAEGIGTSIAAGVAALEADIDGVLITQATCRN